MNGNLQSCYNGLAADGSGVVDEMGKEVRAKQDENKITHQ